MRSAAARKAAAAAASAASSASMKRMTPSQIYQNDSVMTSRLSAAVSAVDSDSPLYMNDSSVAQLFRQLPSGESLDSAAST